MYKVLLTVAILALTGTSTLADTIEGSDAKIEKTAAPILNNILKGMADEDFDAYVRDFDATMQRAVDKDGFHRSLKLTDTLFGQYKSRTYLGFYNKGKMTVVLWKGRFDGTDDDVLIKLVLSKKGDKIEASGLWFQ
jgi:hypothetical protein